MKLPSSTPLCLLLSAAIGSSSPAAVSSVRRAFPGSVASVAGSAGASGPLRVRDDLSAAETGEEIDFAITLRMPNLQELENRLAHRQAVSNAEMEANFRPKTSDYARIAAWLKSQGFTLTQSDATHTNLFARGTVAQLSAAFGVAFARVRTADGEFTSAVTAPSLPEELAGPVLAIVGLQPHLQLRAPKRGFLQAEAVTNVSGYFTPSDVLAAYNVSPALTGSGQNIAIVMAANVSASDLVAFWQAAGIPESQTSYIPVSVLGGPTAASQAANGPEVTLDVEWATGIAPGAAFRIYSPPSLSLSQVLAAFTQVLNDGVSTVAVFSGGSDEYESTSAVLQSYSQTFAQLAAAGVTVIASSGDGGSRPNPSSAPAKGYNPSNPLAVEYPASDPYVTGVGGTNQTFNSQWSATGATAWTPTAGGTGTGGGISTVFNRPAWQTGTGVPAGSMRCVPDVAAVAIATVGSSNDIGAFVVLNGADTGLAGTSLAAPIWAGLVAAINQSRSQGGLANVGFLNPWLYPLIGTNAFQDITSGSNGTDGNYSAGPGYDLCTGVGTPNVGNLITQLSTELAITPPPAGAVSVGSPVTMSAVSHAGSGASTYQWYLDGNAISGATGSSYAISSVGVSNSGLYTVAITNSQGTLTYTVGTLSVNAAPAILAQPASQTAAVGSSATFTVTAGGDFPLNYQWNFNGVPISGAISASYTLGSVQSGNAGSYTVKVTDGQGRSVTSAPASLNVNSPPLIVTQPTPQSAAVGGSVTLTVVATGIPAPTYQWNLNGAPIPGATFSSITLNSLTPAFSGSYTATVSNSAGTVTSNGAIVVVQAAEPAQAPVITSQPQSQTIVSGTTVIFSVAAANSTFQWFDNGVAMPGATSSAVLISGATSGNAGAYNCMVTNAAGSVLSSTANLSITSTTNPGRLVNLSILSNITGNLSMGFVNGGAGTSGSQTLLIRGVGPAIGPGTAFNVPGVLSDPTLTVTQHGVVAPVATNAGWASSAANAQAVAAADSAVGAFPLTNTSSADSAIVSSFAGGQYAATVQGKSGDNGYALTEVYDDTPSAAYTAATPRLVNLSCITQVGANGALNVGFVVGGTSSKTLLIRADGPTLATFGVPGTIPDPQLTVTPLGGSTVLASNAGWGGDPTVASVSAEVGAFAFASGSSKDSAVLVTIPPNAPTTVTVSSVSGLAGTVLVEIYEVP